MPRSLRLPIASLIGAALIGLLAHVLIGSSAWMSPGVLFGELIRGPQEGPDNLILWSLRLPRALMCVVTGAILGISGAVFQAVFRNPLAEPYIVGATSGASVGAAAITLLGLADALAYLAMPLAGFVTGMLSLLLVMGLATRRGVLETPTLLLAGVVMSAMLAGVLSLLLLLAGKDQGAVLRWMLGSMAEATWPKVAMLGTAFALGATLLIRSSRGLNALAIGDETSASVGVDPARLRRRCLIVVTAMTGATVGTVGVIGFVGLVAPHIIRRLISHDLRVVVMASGIAGAILMLLSDTIAQRIIHGTPIPVGIVTAILGAPSLITLLRKKD